MVDVENLQQHNNEDIYKQASKIVSEYLGGDDEEVTVLSLSPYPILIPGPSPSPSPSPDNDARCSN